MSFPIINETSSLEKVIVALGTSERIREQQEKFFAMLRSYGAQPLFADPLPNDVHQLYTRDIGFAYRDIFFYNLNRTLPERIPEFSAIEKLLQWETKGIEVKEIKNGKLEGGDVLAAPEVLYMGITNRTNDAAIAEVEKYYPVHRLYLGNQVMHLDTRMTILPREFLLIHSPAFLYNDIYQLQKKFDFIEVTEKEAHGLGTNVLVLNPQTIVVHAGHQRIQKELRERGFTVEVVEYSEPISLQGSFRCTTLPLGRK